MIETELPIALLGLVIIIPFPGHLLYSDSSRCSFEQFGESFGRHGKVKILALFEGGYHDAAHLA
jgi:hypothetical protein